MTYCTSEQWWKARAHDPRMQQAMWRQQRIAEAREGGQSFVEIGKQWNVSANNARKLYLRALKNRARIQTKALRQHDGSRVAA